MTNIPAKNNGEILYATELFKIIASDKTGGNSTSKTETKIAEATIPASAATTGIIIIANINLVAGAGIGAPNSCTFKLYTGTNAAFGSNTERQALSLGNEYATNNLAAKNGGCFVLFLDSEETWTGQVYVQVTMQNGGAGNGATAYCKQVVVIGV